MDRFELLVEAHRPVLKKLLAELAELLVKHEVRHVIGGAYALSLYVDPRMTIDIDVLVDQKHKTSLDKLLSSRFQVIHSGEFHCTFGEGDVTIDVRYAHTAAEEFALASAIDGMILGTRVRAASREALVRLYLMSSRQQNFADGVAILRSKPVLDLNGLRSAVSADGAALLPKLDAMIEAAARPIMTYEESRARRS